MLAPVYRDEKLGLNLWDLIRLALLASPVAILLLLLRNPSLDPAIQVPGFHFGIVTLAAGSAAIVALAVLAVAEQLRDPRAFFLGLAFCAISGFFFIHGLLTPGVIFKQPSNGITWAPPLSLFLGALFLALSTARLRPDADPWVFRYRKAFAAILFVFWSGYLIVSVAFPSFLTGHPPSLVAARDGGPSTQSKEHHGGGGEYDVAPAGSAGAASQQHRPWIAGVAMIVTASLLLFSALRYTRIYRLSRLPLHATTIAGIVLLMESLLSLFFASLWRVSWWQYHVLIFLGVTAVLYGIILDYRRGAGLSQTVSSLLLKGSVEALEQSYSEVLTGLVAAVEARDAYTKGHSEKVARLAVRIAESLGLPPERLRIVHQAGLMHDIGKIAIPDGILNKPDQLTPSEFEVVKDHPLRSEEMIGRIPSLRPTLRAIRWHHERLDGSGYPDGLTDDNIPLDAKILAVADVYDAMTSGRLYRAAWPQDTVIAHLEQEAGRLYDPRCVEAVRKVALGRADQPVVLVPQLMATED